tara:strand:- start:473 stop:634 length:162 start_codon:yes stop_codon:yes gene_type:complete
MNVNIIILTSEKIYLKFDTSKNLNAKHIYMKRRYFLDDADEYIVQHIKNPAIV